MPESCLLILCAFCLAAALLQTIRLALLRRRANAANQQAKAASQASHDFVHEVSHDLRNSISNQLALLDLAQESDDPVRVRQNLAGIRTCIHQTLALLDDRVRTADGLPPAQPLALDTTLRGLRVLLVEDNALNREVTAASLQSVGVEVAAVADARHLLETLPPDNTGFDLILLDDHMPDMDGPATARTLRDREAAQHARRIPIFGLTADVTVETGLTCLQAGMDQVLTKPLDLQRLAQEVEKRKIQKK